MFADFFLNPLQDKDNYDDRKVGREELDNGLIVSTAYTSDEGYETAIHSDNVGNFEVVERYENNQAAVEGHKKWVEFARDGKGKKIKPIMWSDCDIDKEEVTL